MKAILVELDYKGYYKRFAMTEEEFTSIFPDAPLDEAAHVGSSWTIRPLVHIWYQSNIAVGGDLWENFFTDMEDGLPESDIENDNLAVVDFTDDWWDGELSLAKYAQKHRYTVTITHEYTFEVDAYTVERAEEIAEEGWFMCSNGVPTTNHFRIDYIDGDSVKR